MGTIAQKLTYLEDTKTAIGNAIAAKGGSVTGKTFRQYATEISNLPSGGGDDSMEHYLNNTLTSYTIPAGITSLHNYCFSHLSSLKNLTLNNDITEIGQNAFDYTGIENIVIPSSVETIGPGAFSNTPLKTITFKGDIYIGSRKTNDSAIFSLAKDLEYVRFEGDVESRVSIWNTSAPSFFKNLETAGPLNGGYNVEYSFNVVPENFFRDVINFSQIILKEGITEIKSNNFYVFHRLRTLELPSTITALNSSLFSNNSLREVIFKSVTPPSWNYTRSDWFDIIVPTNSLENYKTAYPDAANRIFAVDNKPVYGAKTQVRYSSQTGTSSFTELTDTTLDSTNVPNSNIKFIHIGDDVTDIANNFLNISNNFVRTINDNNSITRIGNSCLSSWGYISLPNVETIGNNVLQYYYGKTINLGNKLTTIGGDFLAYSYIEELVIPDSVTSCGTNLLNNARGIRKITFGSGLSGPGTVLAFSAGNGNPLEITIKCNPFYNLLNSNNYISKIILTDDVTSIGESGLYNCRNLLSVIIGSNVTSIGQYALYGGSKLESITINATTPPTLANVNSLQDTNNCIIYVPAESVESYKTATNWATYASRIQAIPEE